MRAFVLVIFVVAIVFGGGVYWVDHRLHVPDATAGGARVLVPAGTDLNGMVTRLADVGVLGSAVDRALFTLLIRIRGTSKRLHAGEYQIPATYSLSDVATSLETGTNQVAYRFTIPEGLRVEAVLRRLRDAVELTGELSPSWAEGAFLPETYSYHRGETREAVARRMHAAMNDTLAALWERRAQGLPLTTPEQAVVLASIVERETGDASERSRIAAVFMNRLRLGMPLQSDATVIYGLEREEGPLNRALRHQDLAIDHRWNTYTRKGLPPSPICCPGREALEAVLHPLSTDELYFVANGKGGHSFSTTYDDHLHNVARWRKIRDKHH